MTVSSFLQLANRATKEKFVATYVVRGNSSPFLDTGKISLASDPQLAASHKMNVEDYSGFGQYYAYVFHESNGALVQWIQKGPNVSWCLKWRSINSNQLKCTGPSPYVPSNGYADQGLPFVPTTVLSAVNNFISGQPKRTPSVVSVHSTSFGQLHCLIQTSGDSHLRTCVDEDGFVGSSSYRNLHYSWSVTLVSLNRRPTAKDFSTLLAPSGQLDLPPA
jgi:hypothetical protein